MYFHFSMCIFILIIQDCCITPLSIQISASKFQNLSQIPLKSRGDWKNRGVWLKHHNFSKHPFFFPANHIAESSEISVPLICFLSRLTTGTLREGVNWKKKRFLSGIARTRGGGGLPMPEFFGPLFRSAFLVNKKSLFLQKWQCIELLTVF